MPDTTAIANALSPDDALSSADLWALHADRWHALIQAGVLPKHIQRPGQAIAIARYGQVYGWDPMKSVSLIHVVEGRCELAANAMMGLILVEARKNGDTITPVEMSSERAAIEVQRKGLDPKPVLVEFTVNEAKHLLSRNTWKAYRPDMLWARCVSRVGRRLYPDVIHGAYVHGEVVDASGPTVDDTPRFSMQQLDDQATADPPPETPPQQNDDIEPPDTWEPGDGPDKESPNGHTDMDT